MTDQELDIMFRKLDKQLEYHLELYRLEQLRDSLNSETQKTEMQKLTTQIQRIEQLKRMQGL